MFTATILTLTLLGPCGPNGCSVVDAAPAYAAYYVSPQAVTFAAPPTYRYVQPAITARPTTYTVPAPSAAAPSREYSLKDSDGREWVHTDKHLLQGWVFGRNVALARGRARVVTRTAATACPAGCNCSVPGECGHPGCKCVPAAPLVPPAL